MQFVSGSSAEINIASCYWRSSAPRLSQNGSVRRALHLLRNYTAACEAALSCKQAAAPTGMWTSDDRIDWARRPCWSVFIVSNQAAHYVYIVGLQSTATARTVINLVNQTTCFIVAVPLCISTDLSVALSSFVHLLFFLRSLRPFIRLAWTQVKALSGLSESFWLLFVANCKLRYFAAALCLNKWQISQLGDIQSATVRFKRRYKTWVTTVPLDQWISLNLCAINQTVKWNKE